jgi:hypothetical protein
MVLRTAPGRSVVFEVVSLPAAFIAPKPLLHFAAIPDLVLAFVFLRTACGWHFSDNPTYREVLGNSHFA